MLTVRDFYNGLFYLCVFIAGIMSVFISDNDIIEWCGIVLIAIALIALIVPQFNINRIERKDV